MATKKNSTILERVVFIVGLVGLVLTLRRITTGAAIPETYILLGLFGISIVRSAFIILKGSKNE